ncbi:FAD/NAD(P)-binding protein [Reyranella sp. CPCC 100927]|uniref:FAD/NAD(P)-binding protein n=1 Tax=Reyranella sp. CPCC 100927 TaxID=2599616 RepID=UPI0011B6B2D0|nr:NAD(P)/FAD-dependent oxidoreductase [Reyranella sp. CPCC 100927]TWT15875.1 NAD(P)/FAD-dependent oxidoreductase [Reyranella sp. CPCC 100927]
MDKILDNIGQRKGGDAGIGSTGLGALEDAARHDLQRLNYPTANWVVPATAPDGKPACDVLIVGGGMCGQTAAFALRRDGVCNIRIIDRNPPGREGPWGTFARMETLRSPKQLTGPDLGVATLTYRAWYEAHHGIDGWEALHKAPRLDWLDYLLWVRRIAALPIENDTAMTSLDADGAFLRVSLRGPRGPEVVFARKVVLALGRDGSGAPRWPTFASFDPAGAAVRGRVFHSSDDIDFAVLAGRRVGVLGAGASAFDNAGSALEAGAGAVVMFARRRFLPQVNKSKGASFPGFQRGFAALDDDRRWRFMTYIFDEQAPPPHESVLRCDRHEGFAIRFSEPWTDLAVDGDGVMVTTPAGRHRFDAVIIATGFDVDLTERLELASLRDQIMLWADRRAPAESAAELEAARFPYLGDGFQLCPRSEGATPRLADIHVFNWGCTMSHGPLAGDIPGLGVGATRLAHAIVRDLFVADADCHFEALVAHEEPELAPTRYFVPREQRAVE